MSTSYRSLDPNIWAPIIERVLFQVCYRQLGMVALYCPIDVSIKAIDKLCKEKGMGSWKWLLQDRVIVWENVPVDSAMKIHLYVFGGAWRKKNTVFVRQGFWRMYVLESRLLAINSVLGNMLKNLKPRS